MSIEYAKVESSSKRQLRNGGIGGNGKDSAIGKGESKSCTTQLAALILSVILGKSDEDG